MRSTVTTLLALIALVSSASAGAGKWRGPFGVEPTEKNAAKADPADWDVWWAYNGEEIVHRFGRDWKRTKSFAALHLKILPPLRIAALDAAAPDDVRAAAVTAVGKCGMTLDRERILVPLATDAKAPEAVRQAAIPWKDGAPKPEEDYSRGAAYLARALLDDREHASYMWYTHQRSPQDPTYMPRTRGAGAIGGTLLGHTAGFMDAGIAVEVARLRETGGRSSVSPLKDGKDYRTLFLDPDLNRYVVGGLLQSVGYPTDPDWSEPMVEFFTDPKTPPRARAIAAAALGEIGDPHLAPVLTRLWTDANYPALTTTLRALAELL